MVSTKPHQHENDMYVFKDKKPHRCTGRKRGHGRDQTPES